MNTPTLYIFSGLPASGKSTLSRLLATHLKATHLRIDTIEQGIRDLCSFKVEGEGYRLSYRIAKDNLSLGNSVIADSVNPIELTRNEWQDTVKSVDANYIDIEISCSDQYQHRQRVETRGETVRNLKAPTWEDVMNREYQTWTSEIVKIDTANKTVSESFKELLEKLDIC
ncbi:MAG: AAA family ATPase [Candidatus Cloacimonetes bacterium]|nr:AAA family ATPase [Candidatus Cloacimonadota bacterium]